MNNNAAAHYHTTTATHCPYCALHFGMLIERNGVVTVKPNHQFPVNNGSLCIKGWAAAEILNHPERITQPLAKRANGNWEAISWSAAFQLIASRFTEIQTQHGRNAVGVFGSGALTNEKAYLLGKFARIASGTANIDYNGRFCLSSAAAAGNKAFGMALGTEIKALFVMGSNIAVSSPNAMHISKRMQSLDFLVVCDCFFSEAAQLADLVLPSVHWAEEAGTMTNLEGRVILRQRAVPPPAGVKTDLEILCDIGKQPGFPKQFSFADTRTVFDQLRTVTAGALI